MDKISTSLDNMLGNRYARDHKAGTLSLCKAQACNG